MKTIGILLLVMLISPSVTNAQDKVQFGLRAGMNICFVGGYYEDYHLGMNIQDEQIYGDGTSVGFIFGGILAVHFTEKIGIKAEANVLSKTYTTTYYLKRNYYTSYTYHEDDAMVIELPLFLVYSPFKKMSFSIGPGFNIISTDKEDIASNEISLNAGVQFHITGKLSAEARFSGGLTNLYSGDGIGYLDLQPTLNSFTPQITVEYRF